MKHRLLTLLFAAAFLAGFHEWTPPAHAASGFCDAATQFPSAFSQDDGTNWSLGVVGTTGNSLGVSCNQSWRVVFKAQYKKPGTSTWVLGVSNTLEFPSYNPSSTYAANQFVSFTTSPENPAGFTGYWDNGDGLLTTRPVCAVHWRVHEAYWTANNQLKLDDFYSPVSPITC